jgi:hypothetical protein
LCGVVLHSFLRGDYLSKTLWWHENANGFTVNFLEQWTSFILGLSLYSLLVSKLMYYWLQQTTICCTTYHKLTKCQEEKEVNCFYQPIQLVIRLGYTLSVRIAEGVPYLFKKKKKQRIYGIYHHIPSTTALHYLSL